MALSSTVQIVAGVTQVALAAMLTAAVFSGGEGSAQACSCLRRSPAEYVQQADTVFVGRALGPPPVPAPVPATASAPRPGQLPDRLEVLHVVKGTPGAEVRLPTATTVLSTCDRTFNTGEVALVLVTAGRLSICGGNHALDVVLPELPEYLRLGGPAEKRAPPSSIHAARLTSAAAGARVERALQVGSLALVTLQPDAARRHLVLLRASPGAADAWDVLHRVEQIGCPPRAAGQATDWRPVSWGPCRP
jgi:hypothetical protein